MKIRYILSVITVLVFGYLSAQNNQTIYFDFDVYQLSAKNKSELKKFAETIATNSFTISGYTDPIGTAEYNDQLANKRIEEVKSYLLENGVSIAQISDLETQGKSLNSDEPYHLQRKVVIQIIETESIEESPIIEIATTPEPKTTSVETIDELEIGSSLVIENLEFIPGRHIPQPYSEPELIKLYRVLEQLPNLKIEIQGHVCCVLDRPDGYDGDTRTWNLSVNRAKYVYDFLVLNGIDAERLSYKGFGGSKKIYPETNELNKQANRRVEIVIVEK